MEDPYATHLELSAGNKSYNIYIEMHINLY